MTARRISMLVAPLVLDLVLVQDARAAQAGAPAPAAGFEEVLKVHPYFSKLELERVAGHEPFVFLFQRVAGSPQRVDRIVAELEPVLDATLGNFEQRIAQPNSLAPRAGHERFPVIVLASRGDLDNYQRATRTWWHVGAVALHDRALNACVLYDDTFNPERPLLERQRAARHMLVHACQIAWYAGEGKLALEGWLHEGLADALSNTGADPASVRPDPQALRQIVADLQDEGRRFAHVRTLEELFLVGDSSQLEGFLRSHAPQELRPLQAPDASLSFYRQASLFFAFLWSDENARRRPALVGFVGDALRGSATAARFQERFKPASTTELEQGFLAWLLREHKNAFPLERPDGEKALRALARAEAPGKTQAPARPQTLDLSDATPDERLALAVQRLASGREGEGEALLDALAQETLEEALHARVERERLRLRLWRELRDAHLRALVASGGTLSFDVEGKTQKAKVRVFENGTLVLEQNRAGREKLMPEELDALALAQDIRPSGGANDWVRLWPYALRDDGRVKKLLKDDGGEAGALLRDARDDYPRRLRLGRALARIEELGARAEPATTAEADASVAELRALRTEFGDLEPVQRKDAPIRARVRALLEKKHALFPTSALFGGRLEELENGSVRLTYSFEDPRELDDFDPKLYPVMVLKTVPDPPIADRPFHVEGGDLVGDGRVSLRSRFELAPPLSIRYGLILGEEGGKQDAHYYFYLGMADDGAEHYLAAFDFWALRMFNSDGSDRVDGEQFTWYLGAVYAMQLWHDGSRAYLRCEDRGEISIAAGGRNSGAIFVRSHSDGPVRIPQLVIEGKLVPDSLAGLRKARVERELAAF